MPGQKNKATIDLMRALTQEGIMLAHGNAAAAR
ncbi:hypothetical protein A1F94_000592 [Pyrenophora tritici-repentis]|uniref:Uncharacterized protein n=1 Tax=Pyrenophora tritici-repentis TaxID=45151 RepID=A0A5M9LTE8_9PLEO|nr:hypothetical protein PtrV1_01219 [Pyrenophora tritici-repentis]KAF7453945.1 hypothetical protein A1F99_012030 [Pyrenophora tritici-repentis]KAF7577033.1 hypothetical protein PtrM4_012730 [Pyrenophora tritici-repentis]KAG9387700.1 hypothetical protein A1F94_000592 [Pyrenophora tritici-repentis]KAI0576846.1 hypothetical protein Alg215_07246 [Pyrenophora tritici-repentis]